MRENYQPVGGPPPRLSICLSAGRPCGTVFAFPEQHIVITPGHNRIREPYLRAALEALRNPDDPGRM